MVFSVCNTLSPTYSHPHSHPAVVYNMADEKTTTHPRGIARLLHQDSLLPATASNHSRYNCLHMWSSGTSGIQNK